MEIARLQIAVDATQVPKSTKSVKELGAESRRTETAVRNASSAMKQFIGALAIGATITKVINATVEQERVTAQLESTLRSTGRYTPELSARLQTMAADLQKLTKYGDETIIPMQALLLTFTQIGGQEFDRAQVAILNVATAMGTDLKSSALQVGKALNDPILGVTALARSGIQFTDSQKAVIKSLTETGQVAKAQAVILDELEVQFGGSATAARDTLGGALASLRNSFGDLLEGNVGPSGLTDSINNLNNVLNDPVTKAGFSVLVQGVLDITSAIANAIPQITGFTKWAAEELASILHGVASDDLIRIEDQISDIEEIMSGGAINFGERFRFFGPDGVATYLSDKDLIGKYTELKNARDDILKGMAENKPKTTDFVPTGVAPLIAAAGTATEKLTKAQKDAIRAAEKVAAAQKANEKVIIDLAEAIYQASLNAEDLAKRQATLSLNQYATPEQIASVQMLAGELQRVEDIAARKKEFGSDPAATVRGTVNPLSGGPFDDQFSRFEAEREAEELRYAEQQTRLQEANALDLLTKQKYYALEQQLAQENADRLAQIEQAKTGLLLSTGEQTFGDLAAIAKNYAGEQSALYKTMFAASRAFAIAQSLVAIQTGIALAAANPWPVNLAAMASVAAATGSLVSNIASVAAPSFDGGGFTGTGSRSGGMDGKGGFMAMLHPNETVLDHTKGQGTGGGVTVNVIESKDKAGTQEKRTDADGKESVDVFVSDIYGDGPRSKAIQRAFGLGRQGQ